MHSPPIRSMICKACAVLECSWATEASLVWLLLVTAAVAVAVAVVVVVVVVDVVVDVVVVDVFDDQLRCLTVPSSDTLRLLWIQLSIDLWPSMSLALPSFISQALSTFLGLAWTSLLWYSLSQVSGAR